jgi:hypothetical protein
VIRIEHRRNTLLPKGFSDFLTFGQGFARAPGRRPRAGSPVPVACLPDPQVKPSKIAAAGAACPKPEAA